MDMVEYRLSTLCSLMMRYNMFTKRLTFPAAWPPWCQNGRTGSHWAAARSCSWRKRWWRWGRTVHPDHCSLKHTRTHTHRQSESCQYGQVCVCAWDMYLYCKLYCEFPPKNATFENVLQTERWGISDTDLGIAFHWPRGCWHTGSWSSLLSSGRTPGRPSRTRPLQNKGTPAALWPGSATSAALPLPHTRAWSRNAHTHTHSTRYFTLSLFKLPWWSLHWREKTRKRENQDWENKK